MPSVSSEFSPWEFESQGHALRWMTAAATLPHFFRHADSEERRQGGCRGGVQQTRQPVPSQARPPHDKVGRPGLDQPALGGCSPACLLPETQRQGAQARAASAARCVVGLLPHDLQRSGRLSWGCLQQGVLVRLFPGGPAVRAPSPVGPHTDPERRQRPGCPTCVTAWPARCVSRPDLACVGKRLCGPARTHSDCRDARRWSAHGRRSGRRSTERSPTRAEAGPDDDGDQGVLYRVWCAARMRRPPRRRAPCFCRTRSGGAHGTERAAGAGRQARRTGTR